MTKDTAAIRDQLGNDPDTSFYLNADYTETIQLNELPTIVSGKTLGNSWIVGSSTNGIVGTNTGTEGGGQQVVGGSGRVETIKRIVNNNNTFKEFFVDTTFQDTEEPNTASWNTTNLRLEMDSGTDKSRIYNTIATSSSIFLNLTTITRAKVIATTKIRGGDVILYFLSADGGTNWEQVTNNLEHTFTNTGQDLRFKVIFIGSGANETYISELKVTYS